MASAGGPAPEARFIRETGIAADIAALAEPILDGLGFRLVRVRIMGGQDTIVEIKAETRGLEPLYLELTERKAA